MPSNNLLSLRCPWAIAFGVTLRTRCLRDDNHSGMHEGPGLRNYSDQRVRWMPGDSREYLSDRTDIHAWDVPAPPELTELVGELGWGPTSDPA